MKNVKIFLTDKLHRSEEALQTLNHDVEILKNYLRVEKQAHAKTQQQLAERERELEDLRRETIDKEADLRLKVNELSTRTAEKEKMIEEIGTQKKTLKMHKKVLKEEVLRLRKELNEAEIKAQNKTVALKSLADFFNNQTLAKVR